MNLLNRFHRPLGALLSAAALASLPTHAANIDLADAPLFSSVSVPGNLALALSVEYPTAISPAYPGTTDYVASSTYYGYFDPAKCYLYKYNSTTPAESYFTPYSMASTHTCSSTASVPLWSGNYLNWSSMMSLDGFRWVLTGGTRGTASNDDTTTSTILEKTYVSSQGTHTTNTPEKTLSSTYAAGATPFNWSTGVKTRNWGGGIAMWVTGSGTLSSDSTPASTDYNAQYALTSSSSSSSTCSGRNCTSSSSSSSAGASASTIYKLYIRVKVCDSTVGVESNCVAYGSNYKPEGLLQSYSSKLRYAALGYINTWTTSKDGGALRAPMKFVGPEQPVPGSTAITNTAAEWSSSTGVMLQNPDSSAASTTATAAGVTIANSGVLNYLNKFGKVVTTKGYKKYDPVSELYYAATRYFRNLGNVSAYSSWATSDGDSNDSIATRLDGFPVITTWSDPIAYSCQKNFILGIGDVNANYDGDLYGTSLAQGGTIPSDDTTVNVTTATNMVGQLEGLGALGTKKNSSTGGSSLNSYGGNATNYIAGLAYDAHVKDIRSDLTGTQTINTYWMDVVEYQYFIPKNQYWLAAKYGGFEVPDGFEPYATSNGTSTLASSSWYTNAETITNTKDSSKTASRPDNYFTGNNPEAMRSGLTTAFAKISSEAAAATATALASPSPRQTTSGNANYVASYDPSTWTGSLKGQTASYDSSGSPTYTDVWSAAGLISSLGQANRKIVTWCGSGAVPFQTSLSCSGSFNYVTGVSSQSASDYILYLRGDRSKEIANGGKYRTRTSLLGDIVGSKVTAVAGPDAELTDLYNPGYSSFRRTYASRKTVVYVGANDGMLHAFDGSVTASTGGAELFAYIPSLVYSDSSLDTADGGLSSLGSPSFSHHYLVDATPNVFDVDFYKTPSPTATSNDWHSLLIGGLGKGGKGYYAIDVTDPSAWTSESAVAGKVLWEFTDSRMGYSYGDAQVVKTAKYGWVVVLTSGYNNSDGKGYFFFVHPRTGALLETVELKDASNLAHASAFVPNYKDGTADTLYAGDLQGNVWRLDLTPTSGSYATPTRIAILKDAAGTVQPVTTKPLIEIEPDSLKRYVLIGTGRLLADSDIASIQIQSFYALIDGMSTSGAFYGGSTSLPDGVSFPITRAVLEENSNLLSGIGSNPAKVMGWYFDLSAASSGVAERINVTPTANNGVVAFAANLPNGEVCSPAGTSRAFAVSLSTGQSLLSDSSGKSVASLSLSSVTTEIGFVNIAGKTRLLAGTSAGTVVNLPGSFSSSGSVKRLNWRVVPTAD
ncbi:pilus assembly protein [Uliginosibacterium sp. TH139]|uniref:pilus assembly protein n=1 Tax=Uliginosibacterium sp. TH139 TaxID=2067453 RepID=UPI000C7D6192|nr:PilC/PilY family type IV pilus protein [Uliginosibacterium sp. TH139]PLK50420.1 pilus assembly protein [Uliginosibacterium sp. TH139]